MLAVAPARASGPSYILLGGGKTDFVSRDHPAGDFRIEYRSGLSLVPFYETYVQVRPFVAGELSTLGAGWVGAGILFDIPLGRTGLFLSPSFAPGAYGQGHGKKLGATVEFRSQVEGGYQFGGGERVSLAVSHTSNAGLTKENPGTEAFTVNVQIPIGPLFGR